MGGVVAYEMARQAVDAGDGVELLALIDCAAPAVGSWPPLSDLELLAGFASDLARLAGLETPAGGLAGATVEEALADLVGRGQAAGVLPLGFDAGMLGRLFDLFRVNYRALAAYRPSVSPVGLTLFRASARMESDPALGWNNLAAGGVEVQHIPGDHYSILRGEGAAVLAESVRRLIAARSR
jgi:thioesterase domain-containing protein